MSLQEEKEDEGLNTERTIEYLKEVKVNLTAVNQRNELTISDRKKKIVRLSQEVG